MTSVKRDYHDSEFIPHQTFYTGLTQGASDLTSQIHMFECLLVMPEELSFVNIYSKSDLLFSLWTESYVSAQNGSFCFHFASLW